jgi:hypothetical protein
MGQAAQDIKTSETESIVNASLLRCQVVLDDLGVTLLPECVPMPYKSRLVQSRRGSVCYIRATLWILAFLDHRNLLKV